MEPYLQLFYHEVDDLVVRALFCDIRPYCGKRLIYNAEEHVDEDVGDGNDVAEEEECAQHRAYILHCIKVESSKHHLQTRLYGIYNRLEVIQFLCGSKYIRY